MGTNLKQKQTAALVRMQNFNQSLSSDDGGDDGEWADQVSQSKAPHHTCRYP